MKDEQLISLIHQHMVNGRKIKAMLLTDTYDEMDLFDDYREYLDTHIIDQNEAMDLWSNFFACHCEYKSKKLVIKWTYQPLKKYTS